jgi:hypothetical protein
MVSISFGDLIVMLATLGGFAGVIFAAGKLSSRVDSLEEWRRTIPSELNAIHGSIRDVAAMIKEGR